MTKTVADIPETPHITAVEAVSFLACGKFLTAEDHASMLADALGQGEKIEGRKSNPQWDAASQKLFAAHVAGDIVLYGRLTPRFDGGPQGEPVAVPPEFLAGDDLLVGLFNGIMHKDAARPIYREVHIETAKFARWCKLVSKPKGRRRNPTPNDGREFHQWAASLFKDREYGPSGKEAAEWAANRGLNRPWSREQL